MKYERLTTNNVQSNLQSLLNYAYSKDGEVYLRYANGEEDKRLAEYIAELATEKGCERTADEVIDDGCVECDCEVAVLNAVAIQAAELRHRLADLEDKIESGKMIELPCKLGDTVYWNNGVCVTPYRVDGFADYNDGMGMRLLIGEMQPSLLLVGEDLFFDKTQAERRLAELKGE